MSFDVGALKTHVPVAISTGSPAFRLGTDIGGFVPTADYTGELRALVSIHVLSSFRSHGRNWHLRLPWGWSMGKIGPSECGATGGAAVDRRS